MLAPRKVKILLKITQHVSHGADVERINLVWTLFNEQQKKNPYKKEQTDLEVQTRCLFFEFEFKGYNPPHDFVYL